MVESYLKRALKQPADADANTASVVSRMLAEIESGGEAAARDYARKLDGWEGEIVAPEDWFSDAEKALSDALTAAGMEFEIAEGEGAF